MTVRFRNVDADPLGPVDLWPYEALVTAIERGTATDWARIARAIERRPWGEVARQLEEYFGYERPYGVAPLLERVIARARTAAEQRERAEVAGEVRALQERSGLGAEAFARAIGTSRSRLSTYRSGRVIPSAALMVRMRGVADGAPQVADAPYER